jgi:hypothetical protein
MGKLDHRYRSFRRTSAISLAPDVAVDGEVD